MDLRPENFRDWIPYRFGIDADGPHVSWVYFGDRRLTDPFYDDTLAKVFQRPFSQAFRQRTSLGFLKEMSESSPGVPVKGFIFHVSRCGSTLVSQMLAALPKNIVASEAAPIDLVLRSNAPEEFRIEALRCIVNAFAQRRFDAESALYIKFDPWSISELAVIRKAFPDVPWIFMYRNPVEVMVSNARMPGAQMIPGAISSIFPDMTLEQTLMMSFEERVARTIASFCEAGLGAKDDPKGIFVNYSELPEVFMTRIAAHFGLSFAEEEMEILAKASKRDAKSPSANFSPDSEEKRKSASEAIVEAAERFVDRKYAALETVRLSKI